MSADSEISNVATKRREHVPSFMGDASLYELEPPLVFEDFSWNDEGDEQVTRMTYTYVVVSAARVGGIPETYIFGSLTEDGTRVFMAELPGSVKGYLDHAVALDRAGYRIVSPDEFEEFKKTASIEKGN